jgi:hypothetical protein
MNAGAGIGTTDDVANFTSDATVSTYISVRNSGTGTPWGTLATTPGGSPTIRIGSITNHPLILIVNDTEVARFNTSGFMSIKRLSASGGTALVAGDFALSGGWGTTASVGSVRGVDQWFEFVVTSTGTGQGASPTITYTPKDGTWTTAPVWICQRQDFGSQPTVVFTHTTQTATSLVLTFGGTPVAAETFKVACHTGGI